MSVVIEPKPVTVEITVDHPDKGYMRLHTSEPICLRRYLPQDFDAEQTRRFDTWHPFGPLDSSLLMALVASVNGDGNIGGIRVRVYTSKSIGIFYDPELRPPHLLRMEVRDVLRDEKRHGWTVTVGRLGRIVRRGR